ncbi:glycoside hydrolase/deacetylase [Mycena epipterygia]|nr:glycoside hydrolase/deacetylase [Mycena epipterygia]
MLALTFLLLPLLSAASVHQRHAHHSHNSVKRLPSTWYHRDDHPVHSLFKRGAATDGVAYAAIGSDAWTNAYPPGPPAVPDVNAMPAEWTAALNAAIARGAIPDIPVATNVPNDNPVYPAGSDPNSPEICSATYKCRIAGDIWDAPDGHVGISFDDGPQPASDALLSFLQTNNQPATHFMIGSNIVWYPDEFQKTFAQGDDIAVHTWTHPHMTTQTNLQVVAELGWTIEIIHNSTGGRIPKFWRPPYGDSDVRTTAIAKEVFGLTTIIWNQDTADWSLTSGGTTAAAINSSMTQWLTGSKSPGLIILEHELSDQSVASFVAAYPVMRQNNWNTVSLAQLMGNNASYINAASSTGPVNAIADILDAKSAAGPSASVSPSSAGAAYAGSANTNT